MKRNRSIRRKNSFKKALRKRNIDKNICRSDSPYYNNLNQYSKNKIHCSCEMCRRGEFSRCIQRIKDSMDNAEQELYSEN